MKCERCGRELYVGLNTTEECTCPATEQAQGGTIPTYKANGGLVLPKVNSPSLNPTPDADERWGVMDKLVACLDELRQAGVDVRVSWEMRDDRTHAHIDIVKGRA